LKIDIAKLKDDAASLAAAIGSLEGAVTQLETQPIPVTYPDIQSIPGGKALSDTVANDGAAIATIEGIVAGIAAGALSLTLDDLMRCCSANSAVTDPIASGGATPSLLGQLGGLLTKVAIIGVALGWLDTIYAIFEINDVMFATVKSAEWIAPIVAQVATTQLENLTWADTIHNPVAA
jgi:hypothetical protein